MRPFFILQPALLLLLPILTGPFLISCAEAKPDSRDRPARRMAPPEVVACDRNQLTSYTGAVTGYRRDGDELWLQISTDWDTIEQVQVEVGPAAGTVTQFLLRGDPFTVADWSVLEQSPGVLHDDMRATAWVCLDGKTPPLVDWMPPRIEQ